MSGATKARVRLPLDAVIALLGQDPEWALAARFWTARIAFFVDDERSVLTIESGKAVTFRPNGSASPPCTLRIGGPSGLWDELLQPVPRPFFQDFLPASLHHGFVCEGDLESFYAYYGAISRILVAMRRAVAEQR
ncbi:MAG: hypothetical protein J0H14_05975 [Alphaproteobacteria bacterium]|nr:hypothetical protein [Alphaproteobacteria bacterium]